MNKSLLHSYSRCPDCCIFFLSKISKRLIRTFCCCDPSRTTFSRPSAGQVFLNFQGSEFHQCGFNTVSLILEEQHWAPTHQNAHLPATLPALTSWNCWLKHSWQGPYLSAGSRSLCRVQISWRRDPYTRWWCILWSTHQKSLFSAKICSLTSFLGSMFNC